MDILRGAVRTSCKIYGTIKEQMRIKEIVVDYMEQKQHTWYEYVQRIREERLLNKVMKWILMAIERALGKKCEHKT